MADTLTIEQVDLTQLVPASYNPRTMTPDARKRLERGIREFGLVDPIIARRSDNLVIGGHQRLTAAQSLGLSTVPVVYLNDLSDDQAAALNILLNNPGAQGEWDMPKLTDILSELDGNGFDATLTGFSEQELADFLAPPGGILDGADVDDVPDIPDEPLTKPYDKIILGRHTLVCGDSRDALLWETLLTGRNAGMIWTDPPYGVNHHGGSKDPRSATYRSGDTIENDDLDPAALELLLRDVLSLAFVHCRPGCGWYVAAPPGPLQLQFAVVLTDLKIWRQLLTWEKDSFVFGRSDYHYRHESIFYGWKEGAAHTWNGGRSQDTILDIPRPKVSKDHPTMKPVALVQRCIENSSNPSDLIIDPFAGSGTTLIASEACGRSAAVMELSPAYCDVICTRFETATGLKAERPS